MRMCTQKAMSHNSTPDSKCTRQATNTDLGNDFVKNRDHMKEYLNEIQGIHQIQVQKNIYTHHQ